MNCPQCDEVMVEAVAICNRCGFNAGLNAPSVQSDFGAKVARAFELWKANLADLTVLTLVFMLVAWVPVINIAFIAGYTRSLLKVFRGQGRAQVGDIFSAWDRFANLFVYLLLYLIAVVVLHFIPIVGSLASIALGFVMVPGMYLVIDKGTGAIDAYKWCLDTIQKDFAGWLLAYLVGTVIAFAGLLVLGIGMILTLPVGQLIIVQQYDEAKPA